MTRGVVWFAVIVVIVANASLLWLGEYALVAEGCSGFLVGYFWPRRWRAGR